MYGLKMDDLTEAPKMSLETPVQDVFTPPSIYQAPLLSGESYTHHSAIPPRIEEDTGIPCVLGVDEAGRGPVIGPMVYGVFYLPLALQHSLLSDKHHFDDSKVLTPAVRSDLMQKLCTSEPASDLFENCGWATNVLSARSISSNMLRPTTAAGYNLNAQAMDATIDLIRGVLDKGVNVTEVYIDTIGRPETYQKKLERIFPTLQITVAKKADSLYPVVSAASVVAKVTRDVACETLYEDFAGKATNVTREGWGSGYPSDARCTTWLRNEMDPVFGWGPECRFSWGTATEMLDSKGGAKIEWLEARDEDVENMRVTSFFANGQPPSDGNEASGLASWFGRPVAESVF